MKERVSKSICAFALQIFRLLDQIKPIERLVPVN
jgi:hypothetical protein